MPSNNPHYRPRRSLYQTATTKWLTLTNFAWFLAGVLTLIMVVLVVKSAYILSTGNKKYPYELVALSATQLDYHLRNSRAKGSIVFLYDSTCKTCGKQMDSLLNLRNYEKDNQIALFFISLDEMPTETMAFLESRHVPESMVTYYVAPQSRGNIKTVLENHGTTPITFTFPHTLLFNNSGGLIMEYKGYIRGQEIMRTLNLYKTHQ